MNRALWVSVVSLLLFFHPCLSLRTCGRYEACRVAVTKYEHKTTTTETTTTTTTTPLPLTSIDTFDGAPRSPDDFMDIGSGEGSGDGPEEHEFVAEKTIPVYDEVYLDRIQSEQSEARNTAESSSTSLVDLCSCPNGQTCPSDTDNNQTAILDSYLSLIFCDQLKEQLPKPCGRAKRSVLRVIGNLNSTTALDPFSTNYMDTYNKTLTFCHCEQNDAYTKRPGIEPWNGLFAFAYQCS